MKREHRRQEIGQAPRFGDIFGQDAQRRAFWRLAGIDLAHQPGGTDRAGADGTDGAEAAFAGIPQQARDLEGREHQDQPDQRHGELAEGDQHGQPAPQRGALDRMDAPRHPVGPGPGAEHHDGAGQPQQQRRRQLVDDVLAVFCVLQVRRRLVRDAQDGVAQLGEGRGPVQRVERHRVALQDLVGLPRAKRLVDFRHHGVGLNEGFGGAHRRRLQAGDFLVERVPARGDLFRFGLAFGRRRAQRVELPLGALDLVGIGVLGRQELVAELGDLGAEPVQRLFVGAVRVQHAVHPFDHRRPLVVGGVVDRLGRGRQRAEGQRDKQKKGRKTPAHDHLHLNPRTRWAASGRAGPAIPAPAGPFPSGRQG